MEEEIWTDVTKQIEGRLVRGWLRRTGYDGVNGGYAHVDDLKVTPARDKEEDDVYEYEGVMVYGKQDMGDGHAVEHKEKIKGEMVVEVE